MQWLKEKRFKKYRFGTEVAKLLGISKQRYNGIEKGKYKPTIEQAKTLGKLLEFEWWRLFEDEK